MALTSKQAKFVASYQLNHNSTQSAINAGYPAKSAPSIGCQLLRNPKVIAELDAWKAKKASEITKEDFVDLALNDYKSLELTEANKPRFLDLVGKTLGYTATKQDAGIINNTLNIQLNNTVDQKSLSPAQLWEEARRLLQA